MMFKEVASREGDGDSTFLRIKGGESVKGVFRGDVYQFWVLWPEGGAKQILNHPVHGAAMKFKANFVVYENSKFIAKVFEFSSKINNDLAKLAKVCDIRKTKVMISREGSGKNDTRYTVFPVMNEPLGAGALAQIEQVKLNTLNKAQESDTKEKETPSWDEPMPNFDEFGESNSENLPF